MSSRIARRSLGLGRLGTLAAYALAGVVVVSASAANAKSHLWRFTEFFSNASGNVQFVEMFVFNPAGTAEIQFLGKHLTSNAHDYVFPNNLPAENTFHRWVLIATQDFADLPGAPAPDFVIPANFFDPASDEIHYRDTIDIFTVPSGGMPTDGLHSILTDLSTPVNTPTNFAGVQGTVNLSSIPGLPLWGLCAALVALSSLGIAVHHRRQA